MNPFNNIVYELKDGKGLVKEYNEHNNNRLIFEGEYLNGKRNGKGKEYDIFGLFEFEGEYLNGKRNGKGKKYFNGTLLFEGEYLDDKEWNGIGYDEKNNIIYTLNNNINGKGKEYYENGKLSFEGEYLNGLKLKGKGYEPF